MDVLFARSGASHPDGKLTQTLHIPVTEGLHDAVTVAAATKGVPKAELARDMLQAALSEPELIGMPDDVRRSLAVLAAISGQAEADCARELLRRAIAAEFSTLQMVARQHMAPPVSESVGNRA